MVASTFEKLDRERQAALRHIVMKEDGMQEQEKARELLKEQLSTFCAMPSLDPSAKVLRTQQELSTYLRATPDLSGTAPVRLDLTRSRLTELPPQIICLTTLSELILVGNQLKSLPQELSMCASLKFLSLGCNLLDSIPDLGALPLWHIGLAYNRIDDAGLLSVLGNLPKSVLSLDLCTNMLCRFDGVVSTLDLSLPALSHLSLEGNPCCLRPAYRSSLLGTVFGARLAMLDGEAVMAGERSAEPAAEPTPSEDVPGTTESAPADANQETQSSGESNGAETTDSAVLRLVLSTLDGLTEQGPSADAAPADGAEAPQAEGAPAVPRDRVRVRCSLLGVDRCSEPVEWAPAVDMAASFELTLPRTTALRDLLLVRGTDFVLEHLRPVLSTDEAENTAGQAPGAAAKAAPSAAGGGAAPNAEAADAAATEAFFDTFELANLNVKWRDLCYGASAQTQRCEAAVQLPPKARRGGRKPKVTPPFNVSLNATIEIVA